MKKIQLNQIELKSIIKQMIKEQEQDTDLSGIKLIASKLFSSQIQTHVFHLQTNVNVEHTALQTYYEDIEELIDRLIESYQGNNENITNYKSYPIMDYEGKEQVIEYFQELFDIIEGNRENLPSVIQSIVDEIQELIMSTLYKIKKLNRS